MKKLQTEGVVIWLTGLSGSGKSTLANLLRLRLENQHITSKIIDGDIVRAQLHSHLGFSRADIIKNNHLVVDYCKSHLCDIEVQLVPVIAPFQETRDRARKVLGSAYIEVYVKASLDTCIKRDTKGLYAQARTGKLKNLIGYDPETPYEEPSYPDIVIDTERESERAAVKKILNSVYKNAEQYYEA